MSAGAAARSWSTKAVPRPRYRGSLGNDPIGRRKPSRDRSPSRRSMSIRVLHSFPHRIGAGRICTTAWFEVAGAAAAGGKVTAVPTAVARPLPAGVPVQPTLARGNWRIPYRAFGERTLAIHDRLVACAGLETGRPDRHRPRAALSGALETLKTARRLGIPTVERPNAHTRFAYETVARESERLGVNLPRNHEHAYNAARLAKEEEEFRLADRLLCPSEFVVDTFRDQGFSDSSFTRHTYGYDETVYFADPHKPEPDVGLNALFVGVCAVRKGLHFALEAWLRSPASRREGSGSRASSSLRIRRASLTCWLTRASRSSGTPMTCRR